MTRRRLAILLGALGGLVVVGWFAVHMVIGRIAGGALEERGFVCEPLDVSFAVDGSSVDLGPTRCTAGDGRVRSVRLLGGATAHLDAERRATLLHARGLELTMGEDPPRHAIAALVETGEVPENLQRALHGLARLAEREDLPRLVIDRVLLQRRTMFVTFRDVVIDRDGDAIAMRVAVAEPPPVGSGRLRIAGRMIDLRARATPSEVHLSGRIEVEATIGRREIEEVIPFRLDAGGLDGDDATYEAHIHLSERLRELRARAEQRRADRARAEAEPQEDPGARLHELAESLRGTVERMRAE